MTATAHNLSDLVDRAAARRRGVGQLQRLLELSSDDEFADQKLATLCARDPVLYLRVRQFYGSPIHSGEPIGFRDALEQYGFQLIHGTSVAGAFSTAIGRPVSSSRGPETWRWVLAIVTLSVGVSELTREHRNLAVAAPIAANLGRLLLEVDAPDLLTEAATVAQERGTTLPEAQREIAGFSELELGARVAEHWGIPPDLARLAGDDDRSSELGLQVSRSIEAAGSCGYHDPLAPAPSPPPTMSADAEAVLAPWGGEPWLPFAIHALSTVCGVG